MKEILHGAGNLNSDETYQHLVDTVGGKAAGLLWIQKHLPDIHMPRMIVAPPGTTKQEIFAAAKESGLQYPWIVRGSTPIDNIAGHEDEFPTGVVDSDRFALDTIDYVKKVPSYRPEKAYGFNETTVIVAEHAQSTMVGTLVAHPNQENQLLASVSNFEFVEDPDRAFYFIEDGAVKRSDEISYVGHEVRVPSVIDDRVAAVADIYRRITTIPEFNNGMTYQLEFGPEMESIYQIRDFLQKATANFRIDERDWVTTTTEGLPIVFGVTPVDGVLVRVYTFDRSWLETEIQNTGLVGVHVGSSVDDIPHVLQRDLPIGVMMPVNKANMVQFPYDVTIFTRPHGLLEHKDIKKIRTTGLSIVTTGGFLGWYDRDDQYFSLESGDVVRIISDGIHIQCVKE